MKTIGLIGGLTYVSSLEYYRLLNELALQQSGGTDKPTIILYAVNFGEIKRYSEAHDWKAIAAILCGAAKKLEAAGAECIMIGANTMHQVADEVAQSVSIPLIHLVEETAAVISSMRLKKVALLGTKYTMQLDFYKDILTKHHIETLLPSPQDMELINDAIYNEMSKNIFTAATKAHFVRIILELQQQGAEAVILGCTEIPLLIKQADVGIPVLDTSLIHSKAAIAFSLGK